MKKSTITKLVLALAACAGLIACMVYLLDRYSDQIPFLSRLTSDEIEPEENIFAEFTSFDPEELADVNFPEDSEAETEEKKQAKIRRGYIPLKLHSA